MTALLDILEPRAIELTLIIVLGGIVAGLVTYIIRNLQGSIDMLAPAVQAQDSRVSHLEGRMDRAREELHFTFRAVDLKIEAISFQLESNRQNNSELNSEFHELRRGHYGLFEEVHSRFNRMQTDIHEAQINFQNVNSHLKQVEAGLQQTNSNLKQVETDLKQADSNFKQAENRLQLTEAGLKQVETGLKQTDSNLKQAETRLHQTESGLRLTISNIEMIGSDLENRFESLGTKIDAWTNATNQLTEESQRNIQEIHEIIQHARERIASDD